MPAILTEGDTVEVFQFSVYDAQSDTLILSRRWGTRRAIDTYVKGHVNLASARRIASELVESPHTDIPGLTMIGYNPDALTGFQTQVR